MRFVKKVTGALFLLVSAGAAVSAEPVQLTREHVDIRIIEEPSGTNHFAIVLRDADRQVTHPPDEAVLVVSEETKFELPPGTPFGNEGDPIWILPTQPDPGVLFLGLSAAGLSQFSSVEFIMRAHSGPGDFFLWHFENGFQVHMDSSDGISEVDRVPVIAGSHAHYFWGFTAPGIYQLSFQISGKRPDQEELFWSPETIVTFHVLPLPDETPFQQWQKQNWPEGAPEAVQSPEADPDGDGLVNLVEYGLGLDPNAPGREELPRFTFVMEGDIRYGAVRFSRNKAATDLKFNVLAAGQMTSPDWQRLSAVASIVDHGETETVTVRDDLSAESAAQRFYRLEIQLEPRLTD